jgi:hypothetical protein
MILEFAKLRGARIRCQSNIDFFFATKTVFGIAGRGR